MKQLAFIVKESILFDSLVVKVEQAFKLKLISKDDEGRYIARGNVDGFDVEIVDKIDRLSEILCDENCVIYIRIRSNDFFNNDFEKYLKTQLYKYGIEWIEYVWSPFPPPR